MRQHVLIAVTTRLVVLTALSGGVLAPAPVHAQSRPSATQATLDSLVAAERAFAAMSLREGVRDAFLANLAEDAIVFRPGPVNGRRLFSERPASSAYLDWEPAFAEVSAAGDMGYTTGPFVSRPGGASDSGAGFGHYVTVWKRSAAGEWKVALDVGTSHPESSRPTLTTRMPGRALGGTAAYEQVARADSSLGAAGLTLARTLGRRLAPDARLHREGKVPMPGAAAARDLLGADGRRYSSRLLGGGASMSGDLAYTYGSYELVSAGSNRSLDERGHYLRIWRSNTEGAWQVVLDLASPLRG